MTEEQKAPDAPKPVPLTDLVPMARFVEAYPPSEPFAHRTKSTVYLHVDRRLQIAFERTSEIGYGLCRDDQLAEHGVYGAEADCKEFAENLLQAIEDELSMRNLQHLYRAIGLRIQKWEAERRVHRAKLQKDGLQAGGECQVGNDRSRSYELE